VLDQIVDIPPHLHGMKVMDLVTVEGHWNWILLQNLLPVDTVMKIAAVITPTDDQGHDERIIPGSSGNRFSVSNLYTHLCGYQGEMENTTWRKIWKLHVPEGVKTFTWMMLHGRLLTNSLKSKMRLYNAMCVFCGDVEETILHALRDCPRAMDKWNCVITTSDIASFFMSEENHWLELNINNIVQWNGEANWGDFWALCCHCIWSWHNKELFDVGIVRPSRPVPILMKMMQEYKEVVTTSMVVTRTEKVVNLIGWKPPRESFIKLNTNGAYKVNQVAGCEGVIRGSHGEWLGGFAKGVGLCSAFVAELWGVFEGVSLAYRLLFRNVELEVDSETVVCVIKTGCLKSNGGYSLLKRIKQLMAKDWRVEVSHIYREPRGYRMLTRL
jgi:ribonuclease HI